MAAEYYCLIAGLNEYTFADRRNKVDFTAIREEISEQLTARDRASLELLYSYYDIQNIVNIVSGSKLPFNELGNITLSQIQQELSTEPREDDQHQTLLPRKIRQTIDRFLGITDPDSEMTPIDADIFENRLYEDFYSTCSKDRSEFIKSWAETDRMIRNISAVIRARALNVNVDGMTVGDVDNEEFRMVDFEYFSDLTAVLETTDFVERETRMDILRWQIVEEMTEHDYFNISTLLAYLVKLNILYRWWSLDPKFGEERFRQIVNGFKGQIKIS